MLADSSTLSLGLGHAQDVRTLINVVGTAKEHVDFLQRHLLGLWNQEIDVHCEDDVDGHEEKEALEARICKVVPY